MEDGDADSSPATLSRDLRCYVCKRPFRQLHAFYDRLCPECAALNLAKREQSGDLRGRVALLTGGRVRTGYAVALKLLRAGATVIVTTRFPRDAVRRFAREPDFDRLRARLQLYRLDLIDVPRVEALTAHLEQALPQLDILINLAAQTVYKPPSFHARAVAHELEPLPPELRACLRALPGDPDQPERVLASEPVALARVDEDPRLGARWRAARADDPRLFPDDPAREDPFAAPLDLRSANSWRLKLEEIGAVELLEVVLINITAPFILCSRLRRALARGPARPRFVVNVSAPEGQFYRAYKGPFHPHANMSKAALNMLTRTSADDYARDRIFMNSVDPGWISNDNPQPIAARMTARGFHPPIDVVDAAARVCDPIFVGADDESRCVHGQLLKDYQPAPW
ncbi:MAG: SDR family oxidoreductase [Myxococcales bacterium]|nr:SDR family oxidoreductase [Myxococcales bacterium]